mmetsp:Transcript_14975/g.56404  ORF Transcript_14975/g.56404 Transcript_14975/m.56404 type:complete len:223 (+) Transcript_14975:729-1397(+)
MSCSRERASSSVAAAQQRGHLDRSDGPAAWPGAFVSCMLTSWFTRSLSERSGESLPCASSTGSRYWPVAHCSTRGWNSSTTARSPAASARAMRHTSGSDRHCDCPPPGRSSPRSSAARSAAMGSAASGSGWQSATSIPRSRTVSTKSASSRWVRSVASVSLPGPAGWPDTGSTALTEGTRECSRGSYTRRASSRASMSSGSTWPALGGASGGMRDGVPRTAQ